MRFAFSPSLARSARLLHAGGLLLVAIFFLGACAGTGASSEERNTRVYAASSGEVIEAIGEVTRNMSMNYEASQTGADAYRIEIARGQRMSYPAGTVAARDQEVSQPTIMAYLEGMEGGGTRVRLREVDRGVSGYGRSRDRDTQEFLRQMVNQLDKRFEKAEEMP